MAGLVLRGRTRESSRIEAALDRARSTGRGSVVLVTGEPGIGKTALLRSARDRAHDAGFAVGVGKADEVSRIAPGAPVLQALRSGARPLVTDAQFRSLAPLYDQPLWLVEAVADLLQSRAREVPVLMAVDDLQWADRLSRFALRTAAGRLGGSPVVLLVAARGSRHDFRDLDPVDDGTAVDHVDLAPLGDDDVLAIATEILGQTPAGPDARWLRMVAGNPFLAVQLAEGMAVDRALGRPSGSLPTTLRATLRSRMRRVGGSALAALQLAAVWGRPLDSSDGVAMLGLDPAVLARSVRGAVALGLLVEPGDPIAFRHDLVRELVYGELTDADRVRLHAACAAHVVGIGHSAIEAAPHARLGARRGDPAAVEILRRAAEDCVDAAPQTAADLMQEAFRGVPETDPRWFAVGEQCADVLARAQHGADAAAVLDLLLRRARDPEQHARLQVAAARALLLVGSADEVTDRVTAELSRSGIGPVLRARLEASRALASSRVDAGPVAGTTAEAALARGRELGDGQTEMLGLHALGEVAKNEGRHLAAYRAFHELRTRHGPGFLADEITALQFVDRFDDARALLARASRGEDRHPTAELPSLLCAQLWQDFKLASFDAAVADARALLEVGDELGNYVHRLDARVVMSTVAVVHGDLPRARQLVAMAEDELPRRHAVQAPGLVLAQARIAAAESDFERGARLLRPVLTDHATARTYWPRLLDQMRLGAGIAVAIGDRTFARETMDRAAEGARRNPGVASFEGVALQVRGFVTGDVEALGRAVELLRRSPRAFMLAAALTDHGAALLRTGERTGAVRRLREAAAIFTGLRASAAHAQVRELLDVAGAEEPRPRAGGRALSGPGALTDAEARVADLVSAGHTNRSAAAALGVSVNTVAAHLRAVFTKMDVHSRVQLVNALRAHDRDGG